MPDPTQGAELTPTGAGLTNPEAVSELERTIAALDKITATVEALQKSVEGVPNPVETPSTSVEKGSSAAAALREVSERSASLAKAVSEAKELDVAKLSAEVSALIDVLKGIVEKYPSPEPAAKNADGMKAIVELRAVADDLLALASQVAQLDALSDATLLDISTVAKRVSALAEVVKAEKVDEPKLPDVFKAEDVEAKAMVEGMQGVLQSTGEQAQAVAKMIEESKDNEIGKAAKAQIGVMCAMLSGAHSAVPTMMQKAHKELQSVVADVAKRAQGVVERVEKGQFTDDELNKGVKGLTELLDVLVGKYDASKPVAFEASDLGQILNADRLLAQFEQQIAKLESPPPAADPPPVVDPPPAAPSDELKAVLDRVTALTEQVNTLQTAVAKARDNTPPPATGGQEPPSNSENNDLLFPNNYNDPVHREEVKRRGLEW